MAELPPAEKRALVEKFAPVLLLHPDEDFYPVDPKRFLEESALWRAAAEDAVEAPPLLVNLSDKKLWGKRPRGTKATFPRVPNVARGTLRGLSGEQPAGKVWLGATVDPDTSPAGELPTVRFPFEDIPFGKADLWLDPAGWLESEDVTDKTVNKHANLPKIQQQWDDSATSNPRRNGRFWYTAEVIDQSGIAFLLKFTADKYQDDRSKLLNDLVTSLNGLEDAQMVIYHLFYPGHQDLLRKKDQPPTTPPTEIRTYGGDWTSVAVLAARDKPILPTRPPGPFQGKLIAVSRRNFTFLELSSALRHDLDLRLWSDADLTRMGDTHPLIFVSQGNHSNYLTPGDHESLAPTPPDGVIDQINKAIEDGKKAVDELNSSFDNLDTSRDIVVLLAKVVAGASLFGVFGAVVGLVAGLIEAASTSLPDVSGSIGPKIDPDQFKGSEPGPATTPVGSTTQGIGKALLPTGVSLTDSLSGKLAGQNLQLLAKDTQTWQCSKLTDPLTGVFKDADAEGREYFQLMERKRTSDTAHNQTWWPAQKTPDTRDTDEPGYQGRWGVRVTDDLFGTLSGMIWADYALALAAKLLSPPQQPGGTATSP